ncbi:MAG: hypothetical protein HQL93_05330 [Magnetococcales bacterium]|nr:hypothetical protein [Magnetococcales bacterium]
MRYEAREIMGLFALAHVRTINVKEIMQMLNLDMTQSGGIMRLYNEGCQDGERKGRQEGEAAMLLKQMRRKFGQTPDWVAVKVTSANLDLVLQKRGEKFAQIVI